MDNSTKRIDILNRGEFIDRTVQLVKRISANKGNMTFAINGEWGCGKTFVLDEIQQRLNADTDKNFLVIPYNCWQYDYYSEPLVAIVSTLVDFADTANVIPEDMKTTLKEIALKVGVGFVTRLIKEKSGVDIEETVKDVKEAVKGTKEEIKKAHEFDNYYSFKKALTELKKQLEELAREHTLVFAVDELDRCLPEYAIKVLERLHHISEDVPNLITIIAVDEGRLNNTVESIFGEGSSENYLKKFIRFKVNMDHGEQDNFKFFVKFSEFYFRFDESLYGHLKMSDRFLNELFGNINIRTCEQIIDKASIIHDICFGDDKPDHTIMYAELFFSLLYYHYGTKSIFESKKTASYVSDSFSFFKDIPDCFKGENTGFNFQKGPFYVGMNESVGRLIDVFNVYMVVFYYWYCTPEPKNTFEIGKGEMFPVIDGDAAEIRRLDDNLKIVRKFVELLKTIG